ncbi:MarR family winged helix-turn-helix transcriptional regulator [Salinicola peritrichatus]|uniref:MarR family winged helix-turn-helix transcriptional regulator n=1 Tax=Salinicola peritrichatus TaxID=1267424 RepID=UPI000DA14A42|nr:MarR family transcriptional regulator [Salinicola peritrichatus]
MPDTLIGESLHQLMHAYKRALRQAYADAGLTLTVSHIRTLKAIRSLAPCTAQRIAQRTQRDKAQITRLLHDLLDAGIIAKRPHAEDRRSRILALTAHGHGVMEQIDESERHAHQRLAAGLDAADLETFVRLSRLMVDNLH